MLAKTLSSSFCSTNNRVFDRASSSSSSNDNSGGGELGNGLQTKVSVILKSAKLLDL